ncbi:MULTISPECIES: energy-coupled thiamine transporter ThiT [Ureibacillus]|jgi:thiamine transporter|uniref:Thiamine transporter n=1 Tax=Ureibacillus thermosphaericus TaxID=51173 RepID=A0A840PR98_URETH|nr:energy-coupled thiamine transporter ThiT [Ureibacillus thermosphaericus]MBB5148337.1 thiamine transporter [Ureibacillus thermosphaericus]NKZ31514.1 energy-coupled thiamine transporter ThiT [Ureibacillus thermosphaericus]
MRNQKLLWMVEIAIFAAIGYVLDQLKFSIWAQGGSVSLVMLPIILIAIRWGLSAGLMTGLIVGLLNMTINPYIVHWAQALLDYVFAFTFVGFAAIVRKQVLDGVSGNRKNKIALFVIIGTIIGGLLRFICHTLAGAIFFKEYAGDQNAWIYSIGYNGSYMVPAIILTAVAAVLIFTASPRLIKKEN